MIIYFLRTSCKICDSSSLLSSEKMILRIKKCERGVRNKVFSRKEDLMTPQRQGEIALKLIRHRLRRMMGDAVREMGNIAKECGISLDELKQFVGPTLREALDECLGSKKSENNET